MEIDETLSRLGELCKRCGPAIDPGAATALRLKHTAQQQRTFSSEILLGEPCTDAGSVVDSEFGRDLGAFSARAQLPRIEAIAKQQRERVEQDRLSRSGLSREHCEAVAELGLKGFDNREVADRQRAQHEGWDVRLLQALPGRKRSGVSPQCSLRLSMAK